MGWKGEALEAQGSRQSHAKGQAQAIDQPRGATGGRYVSGAEVWQGGARRKAKDQGQLDCGHEWGGGSRPRPQTTDSYN